MINIPIWVILSALLSSKVPVLLLCANISMTPMFVSEVCVCVCVEKVIVVNCLKSRFVEYLRILYSKNISI